jgi:hypothetical protein
MIPNKAAAISGFIGEERNNNLGIIDAFPFKKASNF